MQNSFPTIELVKALPVLPSRPVDSHKGTFGTVLIMAGSRGMSGAAILCGSAALRGGAGLVRIAVTEGILPIVAASNPCYMTLPLPQDDHGRIANAAAATVVEALRHATVGVVGPGLGQSEGLSALLKAVLTETQCPLVLDADALNLLPPILAARRPGRPLILTPHPGEFARLTESNTHTVQSQRLDLATRYANEHKVVLVLKGHETIVTDGQKASINHTGNPGMAKGGSGDVLAGLIGALVAQGLAPFDAAQLAVYVHGLAGDRARDDIGEVSLIATDLLDYLPDAILAYQRDNRAR